MINFTKNRNSTKPQLSFYKSRHCPCMDDGDSINKSGVHFLFVISIHWPLNVLIIICQNLCQIMHDPFVWWAHFVCNFFVSINFEAFYYSHSGFQVHRSLDLIKKEWWIEVSVTLESNFKCLWMFMTECDWLVGWMNVSFGVYLNVWPAVLHCRFNDFNDGQKVV